MPEELIQAAIADYFEALNAADAEMWADCFAPDARFEDPIGAGVLTERAAIIERAHGLISAFQSLRFSLDYKSVSGSRAALKWSARGVLQDGTKVRLAGIDVLEFDENAKVMSLVGYWNPHEMAPDA